MSRIHPECLEADPSDRSVAADVLGREEPDEEEDEEDDGEEEDEEDQEDDEDQIEDDEGYSE